MQDKGVYNAGDEESVKEKKTKTQLRKEQEVEELKQVLSTKVGRNVLWRVLAKCGIFEGTFTGNSNTFFKEGRRSVGIEILADICKANDMAFINMQIEALNREKD